MHRRCFLIAAVAVAVALPAAAARPKITTDTAPDANFANYRTFSWVNPLPPQGMNPVAFDRIRMTIESGLAQKGYQKADQGGDLSLILSIGAREKTQFESWGRFGLQTDVYQYTQGQLSLDAFDTKTRQAVWHGQATETINPDKPNYSAIDEGVTKLVSRFPPSGGTAGASPAPAPMPAPAPAPAPAQ
jgi:hypothetical protein